MSILWEKYPEINTELKKVESIIQESIKSRNRLLTEICRDLISSGGKRIRSAFAIISSKLGEYDEDKATKIAGALEILHTATLVHDDIIDNAKLRRGKVTVSEKFGVDMAVYTGDFLFTKAILLLTACEGLCTEKIEKPEIAVKAIKTICEGEVDQYQHKFDINTTVFSYLKRIGRKTAIMFAAACIMGAWSSGCPEEVVKTVGRFGLDYGMAFQIKDDINDYMSDTQKEGKPVIKDLNEGVITLPLIYAISKNPGIRNIVSNIRSLKKDLHIDELWEILETIKESGSIDYSLTVMDKYISRGLKELKKLPSNKYTEILQELIQALRA